ncbi:MAG: hypothetical protein LBO69_09980 [Ignavibacteria bacterium]|jgi:hypothetical protein|nr:hypothetical protein [Ignavibacteria bacterium]
MEKLLKSPNATRLVSDARTTEQKMFILKPLSVILLLFIVANIQTIAQSGVSTSKIGDAVISRTVNKAIDATLGDTKIHSSEIVETRVIEKEENADEIIDVLKTKIQKDIRDKGGVIASEPATFTEANIKVKIEHQGFGPGSNGEEGLEQSYLVVTEFSDGGKLWWNIAAYEKVSGGNGGWINPQSAQLAPYDIRYDEATAELLPLPDGAGKMGILIKVPVYKNGVIEGYAVNTDFYSKYPNCIAYLQIADIGDGF